MGTDALEFGVPLLPPQGVQSPVLSVLSILTLPLGGRMKDGACGHTTQVPDILTGPSAALPGHQNPSFVQNSSARRRDMNLASLIVLCPFGRFFLPGLPCCPRWLLTHFQARNIRKQKSVGGDRRDIWEYLCFFIKGRDAKEEFS